MADGSVLITGGAGFIGTALAARLAPARTVVGAAKEEKPAYIFPGEFLAYGDVADPDFIYRLLVEYDVSEVYHLAAVASVSKAQEDPRWAWRTNVLGTVSVLDACRQYAHQGNVISAVCASSDKAYGDGPIPYHEDQALLGADVYSASKAAADIAARSFFSNYFLNVKVVRSVNAYGPGDLEFTRLVPGSIRRMLYGDPAVLYDDARSMVREWVYIEDEVDAYLTVMGRGCPGEAYNISGSGPISVGDFIRQLAIICGGDVVFASKKRDFKEITEQWMDGSKLKALGWSPKVPLKEGLKKAVDWYKNYFNREASQ